MPHPIRLKSWQLVLAATAFVVAADNTALFSALIERLDLQSAAGLGFLTLATALLFVLSSAIFLLAVPARFLRGAIAGALILSAVFGYFVNRLGVVIDTNMYVNVLETVRDRNAAEAAELMSPDLGVYVLLHGILPAAILQLVRVEQSTPWHEFKGRALYLASGLLVVGVLLATDFRYVNLFATEYRDLRYEMVPIYPLGEAVELVSDTFESAPEFHPLNANPFRKRGTDRRVVGVMVVGETARADHFSLNGYERNTNPSLARREDLFFADVEACGTSTAYSVPCMFFLRGRANYTPAVAASESNVLDLLLAAGVTPVWIDNNSSCKGVCSRVKTLNLRERGDGTLQSDGDHDDVLIPAMEDALMQTGGDVLIVLHMMGSHGPAYSERYPPSFEAFAPSCRRRSPVECSTDEVINAYDNSILYTDRILDRLIDRLEQRNAEIDAFLFYASDHGESLGEDGIYLHGLPRAVAPDAQTRVPLLLWLSDGYRQRHPEAADALAGSAADLSHDNIPHTLLGLYDLQTTYYRADLDLAGGALQGLGPGHPLPAD